MSFSQESIYKINQFFESYAQAIDNFDTKKMAYQYSLPCMLTDDDSNLVFHEASKLEGLFNQGVGFYKQFGIAHARPEVMSKRAWSDRTAHVRLCWKYYTAADELLYDCEYNYLLHLDKYDEWRIQVAASVNEKQRMEQWLRERKK